MPGRATASYGDVYRQPIWFKWDRTELDVLVVPPGPGQIVNGSGVLNGGDAKEAQPLASSYMKATEKVIGDWRRAVDAFGSSWLRSHLKLNIYVLGHDVPPAEALREPEIVMVWDASKLNVLGYSIRPGFSLGTLGQNASSDMARAPCITDVSKFYTTSFSYPDMYNIVGHEFGHCLGLQHSTGPEPAADLDIIHAIYEHDIGLAGTPLHCPANLNVKGLELVYDAKAASTAASVPAGSYKKIAC